MYKAFAQIYINGKSLTSLALSLSAWCAHSFHDTTPTEPQHICHALGGNRATTGVYQQASPFSLPNVHILGRHIHP
jgi:hypothetical protein